jgi:glycerate kinase
VDAAQVFAPQKGATAAQVDLLRKRLERLQQMYERDFGVDVSSLVGAGAAGGLAGGLAALGATLVNGFDLVAEEVDLYDTINNVDFVITGEGFVDEQSFDGKVVGSVCDLAVDAGIPVATICGEIDEELPEDLRQRANASSLRALFGEDRAMSQPLQLIEEVATTILRDYTAKTR